MTGICKGCENPAVLHGREYCADCIAKDVDYKPRVKSRVKPHTKRPLYRELASTIQARKNCAKLKPLQIPVPDAAGKATQFAPDTYLPESREMVNPEWFNKHTEEIRKLEDLLPSGSGIDSGTKIDLDESHAGKLILYADYHHMDDTGCYNGWTEHTITVTPSFSGINLRISGPNRNDIKDHLHETFDYALTRDVAYERFLETFPGFAVTSKWQDKYGVPSQCEQTFYVGERFYSDLDAAKSYAADLMEQAFYAPKADTNV